MQRIVRCPLLQCRGQCFHKRINLRFQRIHVRQVGKLNCRHGAQRSDDKLILLVKSNHVPCLVRSINQLQYTDQLILIIFQRHYKLRLRPVSGQAVILPRSGEIKPAARIDIRNIHHFPVNCRVGTHIFLFHRHRRKIVNRFFPPPIDSFGKRLHKFEDQLVILVQVQRAGITVCDFHTVIQNRHKQPVPVFFRGKADSDINNLLKIFTL